MLLSNRFQSAAYLQKRTWVVPTLFSSGTGPLYSSVQYQLNQKGYLVGGGRKTQQTALAINTRDQLVLDHTPWQAKKHRNKDPIRWVPKYTRRKTQWRTRSRKIASRPTSKDTWVMRVPRQTISTDALLIILAHTAILAGKNLTK